MRLRGLLAFPLTPFDTDGEIALPVLARHMERQLESEPAALFVACGTGEFSALSLREYRRVLDCAVATCRGTVPVFAGVGGGPQMARTFAAEASRAGVDGLLLLPPYLVSGPPSGLLAHIRHVADATDLPLMVYQRANAVLDGPTTVALLDIDNVIGVKDGRGDIESARRMINAVRQSGHARADEFIFVNGLPTAELSAHAYDAIGASDYSSAALCFAPEVSGSFHRAYRQGDRAHCDRLIAEFFAPLAQLRDTTPGYAVSLVKAGARLSGLDVGSVRPPLVDPSAAHLERLGEIIAAGQAAARLDGAVV